LGSGGIGAKNNQELVNQPFDKNGITRWLEFEFGSYPKDVKDDDIRFDNENKTATIVTGGRELTYTWSNGRWQQDYSKVKYVSDPEYNKGQEKTQQPNTNPNQGNDKNQITVGGKTIPGKIEFKPKYNPQ